MPKKAVILVTSCNAHRNRADLCRMTWLREWGNLCDYRFVYGNGNDVRSDDELVFPIDDSYLGLPAKIQTSHKWALEQGYDCIIKTDCDVYVHLPRILVHGLGRADYV